MFRRIVSAAFPLTLLLAACGPAPSNPQPSPSTSSEPSSPPVVSPSAQPDATPTPTVTAMPLQYKLQLPSGLDAASGLKVTLLTDSGQAQQSFELTLANGATEVSLPVDRFDKFQRTPIRLEAQPSGTCFRVRIETGFQPVASGLTTDKDLTRQALWTAVDADGATARASSCVHGTVTDTNGTALANASLLLGGTLPGRQPELLHTDAAGRYTLTAAHFAANPIPAGMELHAGLSGFRPQKTPLVPIENTDWNPATNRHDFKLSADTFNQTGIDFTLVAPPNRVKLDLDYPQKLTLTGLDAQLGEQLPPMLQLTVPAQQLQQGRSFSVTALNLGQPYKLVLQETSCRLDTITYYGLADESNTLDTSEWSGQTLNSTCYETFPLQIQITDTQGRGLQGVFVDYSFEEFNPTQLPPDTAPRANRSGTSDASGNFTTSPIPLYQNLMNTLKLRFVKAGYITQSLSYTVVKPNGNAQANQLKVVLSANQ